MPECTVPKFLPTPPHTRICIRDQFLAVTAAFLPYDRYRCVRKKKNNFRGALFSYVFSFLYFLTGAKAACMDGGEMAKKKPPPNLDPARRDGENKNSNPNFTSSWTWKDLSLFVVSRTMKLKCDFADDRGQKKLVVCQGKS